MQTKSREIYLNKIKFSANTVEVPADADEVQGDISEQNQVSANAVEVPADADEVQGDISEQNQVSANAVQVSC